MTKSEKLCVVPAKISHFKIKVGPTSLDFLSEFLLILLSCMKLKAQVRFPVWVLYSIAFWLFRISPDAKLGGILEGERGRGKGREERREGEERRERERENVIHTCTIILKHNIILWRVLSQCNEVSEFGLLSHTVYPVSLLVLSQQTAVGHIFTNHWILLADSTITDSCHHYTPPHTIGGWDSHHGNMVWQIYM